MWFGVDQKPKTKQKRNTTNDGHNVQVMDVAMASDITYILLLANSAAAAPIHASTSHNPQT